MRRSASWLGLGNRQYRHLVGVKAVGIARNRVNIGIFAAALMIGKGLLVPIRGAVSSCGRATTK